jgi:hypothetical protein
LPPLAGFGAFLWFLIRVIPKPSRARYPCMRVAAPMASSFVIGLAGFLSSVIFFKKARASMYRARYGLFALCVLGGLAFGLLGLSQSAPSASANARGAGPASLASLNAPNEPMGVGKGIYPGRVVWVHDPAATNEKYKNGGRRLWFDDSNTDQAVVSSMLERGIEGLAGASSVKDAWERLFRDFNSKRGRGDRGYKKGEIIVIKINLNGTGNGLENINTSPQLCFSLLEQLTKAVGAAEGDIYIGDPNIDCDERQYERVLKGFPGLKFWGRRPGRIRPESSPTDLIFASDGGMKDPLPQAYVDAAYMINAPVLKKHHRAGISLAAKNHFGSIAPFNGNGAFGWHYSLPVPNGMGDNSNGSYGVYRCLVDFMGHKDLGGKTILYLMDGIWGSTNWGHPAIKWRMAPFSKDWPSSIFLSQDPVAIDSVGYDLLHAEFDRRHPSEGRYDPRDDKGPFPQYDGVDDYLHQAADSRNWPRGFSYDPEKDGIPLSPSLGVHEHWNNDRDQKYGRNLGRNEGIELTYIR